MQVAEGGDNVRRVEACRALIKATSCLEKVEKLPARCQLEQQVNVVQRAVHSVELDDEGVITPSKQCALIQGKYSKYSKYSQYSKYSK